MKLYLFLAFWLAAVSVGNANTVHGVVPIVESKADSVFFSVKSPCNFSVSFLASKKAKAVLNGKTHNGAISANKNSDGFLDFKENGTVLFTFTLEPGKLLIVNQQYQFACEPAKIVELARMTGDEQAIRDFEQYSDFNSGLWQNITQVNDKAYFLEELGYFDAAIHILDQMVAKSPQRAVAWLNLGDCLWKTGKADKARHAYATYIALMEQQKKHKKVPERVYERSKPKK